MNACALIAVVAWLTVSPAAAAQLPRKDGNWEITIDVELDGAPGPFPSRTTTQCITKEDVDAGKSTLPGHHAIPGTCTAADHKTDGNRVSWTFKCETPQPLTGAGEIVYLDVNAYNGTLTFTRDGRTMTMKYAGKRRGDCPKPPSREP